MQATPTFGIEKLEGKVKVTKYKFDPKAKEEGRTSFVEKEVIEDAGYLIAFPAGHSIRLSPKEAERQGYIDAAGNLADPDLVDMATGEKVPHIDNSPMARAKRMGGGPLVNITKGEVK